MPLTIFVDFDNTCVQTAALFHAAYDEFRAYMNNLGFDGEQAQQRYDTLDNERTAQLGLNAFRYDRWGDEMAEVYTAMCHERGQDPDATARAAIRAMGIRIMTQAPNEIPGITTTLRALRQAGYRLVLYSLADPRMQPQRIMLSGLAEYFDCTVIVPEKNAIQLGLTLRMMQLQPQQCIMWGDSWRSDIEPALAAGIPTCIHFHAPILYEYDRGHTAPQHDQVVSVHSPQQVVEFLCHTTLGVQSQKLDAVEM